MEWKEIQFEQATYPFILIIIYHPYKKTWSLNNLALSLGLCLDWHRQLWGTSSRAPKKRLATHVSGLSHPRVDLQVMPICKKWGSK